MTSHGPRVASVLIGVSLSVACGASHAAPGDDADLPDAGGAVACAAGELVVVDDLGGVSGRALGVSAGHWGVTYSYGRSERFVIVDGGSGAVVEAIDEYAAGMMSIGTDEGFVVVQGSRVVYLDRDGRTRGELPLESRLAVGPHGFVPLEDDGDRIYAWLAEPSGGATSPARLVLLPRTPDGAVVPLSLVLDEAPIAFAAAPDGRVLLIENDPTAGAAPRVHELIVAPSGVTSVSDAPFAGGFAAVAAAAWGGADGGGTDAWLVSGALATPGTERLVARVARIAGGRTEALAIDGAPELEGRVAGGLVREPDGTIHATFTTPYLASAVDHVTLSPTGASRVDDLGGSMQGTSPRIARSAGGCRGVLIGIGATAATSESSLVIRVVP